MSGAEGPEGEHLLASLGVTRGEAAEVIHQHLMARRLWARPPARPATPAELVKVVRTYATRKAAFAELMRQGRLPPRPGDEP
jgi:uncharacterized protein YjiS (DUF1127 family)